MKTYNIFRSTSICLAILFFAFIFAPVRVMAAEAPVNLGTTASFAVLAGSTVTNTGTTVISGSAGGDVGVSPGSAVVGFPPGTISDGTIHAGDAVAIQAQIDLGTAYNVAAGRTVTADLTGQDLGGLTLTSGVYYFASSAQLTGELTLDAGGNPDAAFIFQIGSTLTTASSSSVSLINGAQYCRVFWQVGSSATLGTSSQFIGHIFAMASITVTTSATVQGQLLARTGAVTLDSNIITNGVCAAPTPIPTATTLTGTAGTTKSPATTATTLTGTAGTTKSPATTATTLTGTAGTTKSPATTATTLTGTAGTTVPEGLPDTGESAAGNNMVIGLILLVLAASILTINLRRTRSR